MHHDKATMTAMTIEYARAISLWKYDGIYSVYDHSGDNLDDFMDGAHFVCIDTDGKLTGYFCFGKNARIPTVEADVYDEGFLDIGLGLKPDLCGKGNGLLFFNIGLDFAKKFYGTTHFRLAVAGFNERAVKLYKRAGFYVEREVTHSRSGARFLILKCVVPN